MALPELPDLETLAVFLDFDGTLVDLADRPEAVEVPQEVRALLARLSARLGGALAIVTGREVETIDRFLSGLTLPVAGVHGVIRRGADGRYHDSHHETLPVERLASRLEPLLERAPDLLVEPKGGSLALHYRARPDLEAACLAAMERAIEDLPDAVLLHGKFVIEVKPKGRDKGIAIRDFMAEPPFSGRRPLYAGDDVTDEAAFEVVESLGGLTVKVGDGDTLARYRCASPADLTGWLAKSLEALEA